MARLTCPRTTLVRLPSGSPRAAKLAGKEVDEVILGQVLTAGQGQNPARQAAMKAGIPEEDGLEPQSGVRSGLRAVALGMLHVASGDADVIVAGGQESMSLSPHAATCEAERRWAT